MKKQKRGDAMLKRAWEDYRQEIMVVVAITSICAIAFGAFSLVTSKWVSNACVECITECKEDMPGTSTFQCKVKCNCANANSSEIPIVVPMAR